MKAIYLILISILFVASGQLLLKKGVMDAGELDFGNLTQTIPKLLTSPLLLLGIAIFVSSSVLWLIALSRTELSYAYPLLSIGYALVAVLSWLFFDEKLGVLRIAGIGVIIIGISLMSMENTKK